MAKHKLNSRYEILTPTGWQDFHGIRKTKKESYTKITTGIGELKSSNNHPVKVSGEWKIASDIEPNDILDGENGSVSVVEVAHVLKPIDLYDLLEVGGLHEYYTNGIVSHNCEFLGSQETLVKASKLIALAFKTPILESEDGLSVYENPIKGHIYTVLVDSSRSIGKDYNAVVVVDSTDMPYKVVAAYRNNTIPIPIFPNLIKKIADKYNEAYVLVEINDTGQQVADILKDELEYENMLNITIRGKKGQKIGEGFGQSRSYSGIKMSSMVKKTGCGVIKEMIEGDKLLLNDFDIIAEISTYIAKAGSYEASDGYNDDLVACLVMFGWLTTQDYFKDLVNMDIRKRLFEEKLKRLEEDMIPFGFLDDGEDDMEEASRMLASENNLKPKQIGRDKSWMGDADEIM